MAVGRKPRPEEQPFGGEILGIAAIALAIFLTLAFSSYRPGNAENNQVGLIGHLLADLLCPAFGQACYLLPLVQVYLAGVLLRLWSCPAPLSQMVAGTVFLFASTAFLALWKEGASVAQAGGWIGGFLAFQLRTGLNRLGAYLFLLPVLAASFMCLTRLSLYGTS